jgi:hypothetical protein
MNACAAGLVFVVCLATAGCTFDGGAWFAELQPQLAASYQPAADRNVDGRFQRLASGYEVALDRAELVVGALDLIAAASAGAGAFDPAHPPPGYSLCHNGHCHADDGRLVPYAAIEAELAGGGDAGGAAPVLSLAGGGFNLLAPQAIALTCPEGCRLGRTHIVRVEANVTSVHLEGAVRSGPGAPQMLGERRFTVDLPAAGAPIGRLAGPLDLPADNRHPPQVDLQVAIALGPQLLDRLDWASFPDEPGRKLLADALSKIPLDTRLRR